MNNKENILKKKINVTPKKKIIKTPKKNSYQNVKEKQSCKKSKISSLKKKTELDVELETFSITNFQDKKF